MYEANKINKISVKSSLSITNVKIIPFVYLDEVMQPKSVYSIVNNKLNLINQPDTSVVLYIDSSSTADYYEYRIPLKTSGVRIYGQDIYGNELGKLLKNQIIISVNGYKLADNEYDILDDNHIRILISNNKDYSNVIIYSSPDLIYQGNLKLNLPIVDKYQATILDYSPNNYIFFKNGYLINPKYIANEGSTVTFNLSINTAIDKIEYYSLPARVTCYNFDAILGVFDYGPYDNYNNRLPILYDAIITLDDQAKYLIDDLRIGFFVKEEENTGTGVLEIIDDNYETTKLKCLTLVKFSKDFYNQTEYFVQVPDTRSITHYLSDYDLKNRFLPEILGSFQKLLLNETYDSLLRIKNLRSIENVNSKDITKLLKLLGNPVNITTNTLVDKHNLLDELTTFYKNVGNRQSYNFYNFSTTKGNIVKIEQLYTPIKDIESSDSVKRYQTFRTALELGAIERREYRFPYTDYGYVNISANSEDTPNNTSKKQYRTPGELMNMDDAHILTFLDEFDPSTSLRDKNFGGYKNSPEYLPAILSSNWDVYVNNEDGTTTLTTFIIDTNEYKILPTKGPNMPSENYDYGTITEKAENFYDYGKVEDKIKGHWVEWLEWDRPANWYPTNHVAISVNVPVNTDYKIFMKQFQNSFYNLASTVLYIHGTIESYAIAKDNKWEDGDDIQYGIMTGPIYQTIEYTLASDPTRQANF